MIRDDTSCLTPKAQVNDCIVDDDSIRKGDDNPASNPKVQLHDRIVDDYDSWFNSDSSYSLSTCDDRKQDNESDKKLRK